MIARLIVLTLGLALAAPCFAAPDCERDLLRQSELDDHGVYSFDANPFYNGALLLELFGPMKNSLPAWLKWLESGDTAVAPQGPGLYLGARSFVVAKFMEFPIDGGIMQFSGGDIEHRQITSVMEIPRGEITHMRGQSDEAKHAREKLLTQLDTQLFGMYGAIESDTYDNLTMRSIRGDHILSASLNPRVRYKATPYGLGIVPPGFKPPNSPLDDLNGVAQVISEDEESVVIKVKLGQRDGPLNRNQEILQRMFFITHWQMVQKAYRKTGLFADNFNSAVYLLDDFIRSMDQSGPDQDIYLMYDARAWKSMMFRLKLAHQYVSIFMTGAGMQPYHYQTISDVFYPLYPIYGMAVEKHLTSELEFKRLFHNANPDPLNVLRGFTERRGLNLHFYHQVAKQLPTGSKLKVVSKSAVHTRLYKGVGFRLDHSEFNAEWNAQKDTLIGDRETFLENTKPR